jgi:hypothetical protein
VKSATASLSGHQVQAAHLPDENDPALAAEGANDGDEHPGWDDRGSLVDAWLRQLRVSGHLENTTVNEYERVLRKLVLPELGTVRLNELTSLLRGPKFALASTCR